MADPGFPVAGGGADLQHGCFSAKTYVKMKELDPVGGGGAPAAPPGSANGNTRRKTFHTGKLTWMVLVLPETIEIFSNGEQI